MKIIEISKMKPVRSTGLPILRVAKTKVAFGASVIKHMKLDPDENVHLEFAMSDDETLHVRPNQSDNSAEFVKRANKQWELYNSAIAKMIRDLSESENESIPCRVMNANDEGWYPVITSYWKTVSNQ